MSAFRRKVLDLIAGSWSYLVIRKNFVRASDRSLFPRADHGVLPLACSEVFVSPSSPDTRRLDEAGGKKSRTFSNSQLPRSNEIISAQEVPNVPSGAASLVYLRDFHESTEAALFHLTQN